jgi:hypothetical protein
MAGPLHWHDAAHYRFGLRVFGNQDRLLERASIIAHEAIVYMQLINSSLATNFAMVCAFALATNAARAPRSERQVGELVGQDLLLGRLPRVLRLDGFPNARFALHVLHIDHRLSITRPVHLLFSF